MKKSLYIFICLVLFIFHAFSQGCANDPDISPNGSPSEQNYIIANTDFCNSFNWDGPMTVSSASTLPPDWLLFFDEEFNGPILNEDYWIPRLPWSNSDDKANDGSLIGLKMPENISFQNGLIKLRGRLDPGLHDYWSGGVYSGLKYSTYTSAGISTRFQIPINSRIQTSAKPFPESNWNWSAFWLFGDNLEEIDGFEIVNSTSNTMDDSYPDFFHKMTVHANKYGYSGNGYSHQEGVQKMHYISYPNTAHQLTSSLFQYDVIWDKWKVQWYFNTSLTHYICRNYYVPSNWTSSYASTHFRTYPIGSYDDMVAHLGDKFAISQYYPNYCPMHLIMDFDIRSGTQTTYDANKTYDIDYVRIWLRSNCNISNYVSSVNKIMGYSNSNTIIETGKNVYTQSGQNISIPNGNYGFYAATNEIGLLDGFSAQLGSTFSSYITSCAQAWDRRMRSDTSITNDQKNQGFYDDINIKYLHDKYTIIKIQSLSTNILNAYLYDINGQIIFKKLEINSLEFIIENRELMNGIYIIKIERDNNCTYKKVIF